MARTRKSRSYRRYPQKQDQQAEFPIPLNHEAKIIFAITILLPMACYFLMRGCQYRPLDLKHRFRRFNGRSSKQGDAKREIAQIETSREAYMPNPLPVEKIP